MAKSLNFNSINKRYLTVSLADNNHTTLMVGTPTKSVMDELVRLMDSMNGNEADNVAMDDLYEACAKIMSRNKGGVNITKEYLAEFFDIEDITIFFNAYMEFLDEIVASKN